MQPLLGLVQQVLVRHWRSGLIQPLAEDHQSGLMQLLAEAESEAQAESEAEVEDLQL